MQKNSKDFSMQEAMNLAKSDAGQQLLALLRKVDSDLLQQAADQAAAGNYGGAQASLGILLSDPQVQKLLQQMGG